MRPILSIVLPVYKVEPYLRKCVESLFNQDLPKDDYEIVLVDDGSTDACPVICDDYGKRFDNVKVVHRKNGGLSAARNSGIDVAIGKYVQFVDSDDYLEPNVLKTLVDKIESEGLDVLRFNYQNVNGQYVVFEPNKESKPFVDYSEEPCNGLTFLSERLGYGCYAWQFILRRELLNSCRFKEGIYFEDTEWTPRMLMKANRVASANLMVYNYLQREGSITQSVDVEKKRKVLEDKLFLVDSMMQQMKLTDDERWFKGMIAQLTLSSIDDVSMNFYGERKHYLKLLESKGVYPLSSYHATASARSKIHWANISPALLCFLIHLKNVR